MDRDRLLAILNQVLTLEVRSFARYAAEVSLPRVEGVKEGELLDLLRGIVRDEDRTIVRLGEAIEGLGAHPEIGPYDFGIGFYNYLRADYLGGVVIERLRSELACLRGIEESLDGEPAAQGIVRDAVLRKESAIERLEAFFAGLATAKGTAAQ